MRTEIKNLPGFFEILEHNARNNLKNKPGMIPDIGG